MKNVGLYKFSFKKVKLKDTNIEIGENDMNLNVDCF